MRRILAILFSVAMLTTIAHAIEPSELAQLVGYTIIDSSSVTGDFEGADFDKVVKLDNGMIFEFQSYDYFYAFRPEVVIFAKKVTLSTGKDFINYKLVIEDGDEVYDVIRIR
jgi:hypothetical protein